MLHRSEEAGIVRGELQNCVAADRSANDELIPSFGLPGDWPKPKPATMWPAARTK
jgi:hypothetical protein